MSYSVYPTPDFKKFFKTLYRKYPSLKADLQELIDTLIENPDVGVNLGHGVYMGVATNPDILCNGAALLPALTTAVKIPPGFGYCPVVFQDHAYALVVGIINKLCRFGATTSFMFIFAIPIVSYIKTNKLKI